MNLTSFRKDIYNLSQAVIENHEALEIPIGDGEDGVVILSMSDYRSLKELAYLENTGTLATVFERMEQEVEDDFLIEDVL